MSKLLPLLITVALFSATVAQAESVCRVNIAAMKGGQPLLDTAKISVINTRTEQLVTSTASHRISTEVDCGIRYRAEVDYKGVIKKNTFDVGVGLTTDVVIGF